ncbi:hypothetical protein [Aeromicrobium duanguangcaii]|uniref:hypothetical protein n=1 Tax=Aeromicrobium duanguangcaii TaxID=2968086 RepID=UPI002016D543|nr:hypothetical protein [Aeromicrobium duanguangcaii]MCL3836885.1 hypothetical protein [Aeromicrobium duanguangcaii]
MNRRIAWAALAVASLVLLGACGGGDDTPSASATAVVADVSGSAEKLGLREDATTELGAAVRAMSAPAKVFLIAFNTEVGSSVCSPVTVDLPWSDVSTDIEDTKASYEPQALAAADPYLECARTSVKKDGTDVFGGIAAGHQLIKAAPGTKKLVLVTDGCHTYQFKTCVKQVADADWRAAKVAGLDDTMKPDLAGVDITIKGLARGSHLQSAQVQGLRAFYEEYAETTGAALTFSE